MARRVAVDWAALAVAVEYACAERGLSFRKAAKEMGMSPPCLTRVCQGRALSADNYVTLLLWLNPVESWHWSWMSEVTSDGS